MREVLKDNSTTRAYLESLPKEQYCFGRNTSLLPKGWQNYLTRRKENEN